MSGRDKTYLNNFNTWLDCVLKYVRMHWSKKLHTIQNIECNQFYFSEYR